MVKVGPASFRTIARFAGSETGAAERQNEVRVEKTCVTMVVPEKIVKSHEQSLNSLEVECELCLQTTHHSSHNEGSERGPSQTKECGECSPVLHSRSTAQEINTSWSQKQQCQ